MKKELDGNDESAMTEQSESESECEHENLNVNESQEDALTGVRGRSTSLEHINITSSFGSYPHNKTIYDRFSMNIPLSTNQYMLPIRPTEENSLKKCVYMYEDKYTFSRILPPGAFVFNSHFECGNLHSAHLLQLKSNYPGKSSHIFYDLYMHEDINSMTGTAQWFYFSVAGMRAKQTVTFSIRNFSKSESLFDLGMKPLILSTKSGVGWTRCGSNLTYREETESKESNNRQNNCRQRYYVLTFTHTFEHDEDLCYFAYSHPYSYSDLRNYLNSINKPVIFTREELCKTLAGNVCELLTITNPPPTPTTSDVTDNTSTPNTPTTSIKPHILITARVHPGEVSSSWIMQGVMDFLLSDRPEANHLRDLCIFKIIPMLNPDGVINGNNRASLSGQDLNRVWDNPNPESYPTIFHCKNLAQSLQSPSSSSKICLYLDLHGHSKHKGIFAFGCVTGDEKEDLISSMSCRERNISPSQLRMKVIRSNSTSTTPTTSTSTATITTTSTSERSQLTELVATQLSQGVAIQTKERSRSAGPQGRQVPRAPTSSSSPPPDQFIKKSSRLEMDSVVSSSSRSVSPARLLELKYERVKKLPKILNKKIRAFSHRLCSYRVPSNKLSTSRAVMALEIGIENSYTIEASMAGSHDELFNPDDYLQIGGEICLSISEWLTTDNLLTDFTSLSIENPEISSDSDTSTTTTTTTNTQIPIKRVPPRRRLTNPGDISRSEGIASTMKNEKLGHDTRHSISPDIIFTDPSEVPITKVMSTEKQSAALRQIRQQSRVQRVRSIPAHPISMMMGGNIVFDQIPKDSKSQLQLFTAEGKTFQRKSEKPKPINLSLGN